MREGGERVEREGSGATGWEEVASLAGRMENENDDADNSLKTDFEMYLATVGEVDLDDIRREISKYTDKIEEEKLERIYDEWTVNPESSAKSAVEYFAELFEVEPVPDFKFASKDESDGKQTESGGSCQNNEDGVSIVINQDGSDEDDVVFRIATLGHEMWHARQRMMAKTADEKRGALYRYNIDNYIKLEVSPGLYKKQLVEAEAYAVQEVISGLLTEHEKRINAPRWNAVEDALRPERIKEVVYTAMENFSEKSFLDTMEVSGLEELGEAYKKDLVKVVTNAVGYFSGLLGDESYKVEKMDWRNGIGADVEEKKVLLNPDWAQNQECNKMLAMTANVVYWLHGAEKRYNSDDKKGIIYRYGERIGKDVLKAESSAFADAINTRLKDDNFYL